MKPGPLRVLHVGADNSPGGVASYINTIVNNLDDTRYQFLATVSQTSGKRFLSPRLELHEFPGDYGVLSFRTQVAGLRQLLRSTAPDVLHLHTARSGLLGTAASAGSGCPVVYSGHSWRFEQKHRLLDRMVFRQVEKYVSLKAGFVTFLTTRDRQFGVDQGLVRADVSAAINTRIDVPDTRAVLQRRFGADRSAPSTMTVVNVGLLTERKNPMLFLDVAARVLRERGDVRFLWLGDGDMRAATLARCSSLGIEDRVSFPGNRSRPEVEAALQAATALLFTSRFEGVPLAILEAKLSGLPLVAARYPGVDAVVRHDTDGFVFGLDEPDLGATQLLNLLQSADTQKRFGEAGLEFAVREHSDPKVMAAEFADIYNRLALSKREHSRS